MPYSLTLVDFVLAILAPVSPILIWSAKDYFRQRDARDLSEHILKSARSLWDRIKAMKASHDGDEHLVESRQLQSAIYARRASSPLVLPFIYTLMRGPLEDQMDEGARSWLEELERAGAAAGVFKSGADGATER